VEIGKFNGNLTIINVMSVNVMGASSSPLTEDR